MNKYLSGLLQPLLLVLFVANLLFSSNIDPLQNAFESPPQTVEPWVLWMWMNGNVTQKGIDADLAAMNEAGVNGVVIYNIGPHPFTPETPAAGPADYLSEKWVELFEYAADKAKQYNMQVAISICDGFTSAGGPAITPENSMKQIVWSEIHVTGPGKMSQKLAKPPANLDYYQDIAVLAFPTPRAKIQSMHDILKNVTFNVQSLNTDKILDNDLNSWTLVQRPVNSDAYIQFELKKPITCQSLAIAMPEGREKRASGVEIQISKDGKTFTTVSTSALFWRRKHDVTRKDLYTTNTITLGFPPVTSQYFRLKFNSSGDYRWIYRQLPARI